jgi:hypothetical protein
LPAFLVDKLASTSVLELALPCELVRQDDDVTE